MLEYSLVPSNVLAVTLNAICQSNYAQSNFAIFDFTKVNYAFIKSIKADNNKGLCFSGKCVVQAILPNDDWEYQVIDFDMNGDILMFGTVHGMYEMLDDAIESLSNEKFLN